MELVVALGLIAFKVALLIAILLLLPLPLTWLERKIAGHMQQRMGPMRVGWHGLLQPVADGIKLLTKEDHIQAEADRFLFKLAPILAMATPFVVFVATRTRPRRLRASPIGSPPSRAATTIVQRP